MSGAVARRGYSVFANREYRMVQPSLRPQDVVVLAKLLSYDGPRPSMAQMGTDPSISPSEVHAALKRLALARLVNSDADGHRPLLDAVLEFLIHGLKYAFPAKARRVDARGTDLPCCAAAQQARCARGGPASRLDVSPRQSAGRQPRAPVQDGSRRSSSR
jgi:hypothetical protein